MKKIIIGIIVALVVLVGVFFIYTSRGTAAKSDIVAFVGNINKFQLNVASNYAEENGDLAKAINEINNSDMMKQKALKMWFAAIKINVVKVRKEGGDTVLDAQIFSPNGKKIVNDFQYNVNGLDINNQTVEDSNTNGDYLEGQISSAFLNAVEGNIANIVETDVQIKMKKTMSGWKIVNDDAVIQGLLGGASIEDILN